MVQLTPPGSHARSACPTAFRHSTTNPGTIRGLHLVVDDIVEARQALVGHGVDIENISDLGGMLYAGFADPDGNTWTLQEITR